MRFDNLRTHKFDRILLIKPSAMGDVIHALPVLAKLRQRYPAARIDWMLTPPNAQLVQRHPALSNVVLFQRQSYGRPWRDWSSPMQFAGLLGELRNARYDLVIDLHGQFRSAFFTLVTGARTRIGFDRPRRRVRFAGRALPPQAFEHAWQGAREMSWVAYTHRIPIPTLDAHAIDRYLWLGDLLDLPPGPAEMDLHIAPEAQRKIDQILETEGAAGKSIALLCPGTIWQTKRWLPANFAQVGRHFLELGWAVILSGSSKDRAACREVAAQCPGVIDLSGRTTPSELAALTGRADICITNDSGPMHLAAALGTPLVAIFGPTDPLWVGPYGQPDAVVRAGLPCSPCYLRDLRQCRHNHACMHEVSAQTVIDRAERVLGARPPDTVLQPARTPIQVRQHNLRRIAN